MRLRPPLRQNQITDGHDFEGGAGIRKADDKSSSLVRPARESKIDQSATTQSVQDDANKSESPK